MGSIGLTLLPLIAISGFAAFILIVAWRKFGRVRHALTWGCSFGLLAAMWILCLAGAGLGERVGMVATSLLGGGAVLLGTIGFRQRAQLTIHAGTLGAAYVFQILATIVLLAAGQTGRVPAIPGYLQDLAMLVIAARTLQGRRRTEREAELGVHVAMMGATLWILLRLADAVGLGAALPMARMMANLVQPAAVLAVALAAIFVIAADLADQLRRVASTDRLTGLLNRRGFEEALGSIVTSARRHDRSMALLIADIDRFKSINDRFGHAGGDDVIREFAACLQRGVARRDLVARVGGEEFAVLLADVDAASALCAAEVLREQVGDLRIALAKPLAITASFGVVLFGGRSDVSQTDLLARADEALYQSKTGGRNRVTVAA